MGINMQMSLLSPFMSHVGVCSLFVSLCLWRFWLVFYSDGERQCPPRSSPVREDRCGTKTSQCRSDLCAPQATFEHNKAMKYIQLIKINTECFHSCCTDSSFCHLSGIDVNILDQKGLTALDTVKDMPSQKSRQIAALIQGKDHMYKQREMWWEGTTQFHIYLRWFNLLLSIAGHMTGKPPDIDLPPPPIPPPQESPSPRKRGKIYQMSQAKKVECLYSSTSNSVSSFNRKQWAGKCSKEVVIHFFQLRTCFSFMWFLHLIYTFFTVIGDLEKMSELISGLAPGPEEESPYEALFEATSCHSLDSLTSGKSSDRDSGRPDSEAGKVSSSLTETHPLTHTHTVSLSQGNYKEMKCRAPTRGWWWSFLHMTGPQTPPAVHFLWCIVDLQCIS